MKDNQESFAAVNLSTCVILIPVYRKAPTDNELRSIRRCLDVFNDRDVIYICPEWMELSTYPAAGCERFPSVFFENIELYSELCCSRNFYDRFKEYDYMLICQPDCWVFDDRLDYFMGLGYDYIGAPWYHIKLVPDNSVGNGGFSLRRISKFRELSGTEGRHHPEDVWWCVTKADHLYIAPAEAAATFSLEHHPERWYKITGGILPMGCHKPWQGGRYEEFWCRFGVPEMI